MKSIRRILVASALAAALLLPAPASAQPPTIPAGCTIDGLSLICMPPEGWNGELIVFAHGYVPVQLPLGFYNLQLADGTFLPELVMRLRYAFATTTYRKNGLAILEGVEDIRNL